MTNYFHRNSFTYLYLFLVCFVSGIIFWQGTSGSFLFDDFATLSELKLVTNFQTFTQYVLSGITGPTGRPISLLVLAFNSDAWPSSPQTFIITNIVIHLINTVLVFFVVRQITKLTPYKDQRLIFALLTATIWSILPNHVSTVIYIVQIMTMLATLFGLLSILFTVKYILSVERQTPNLIFWLISLFFLVLGVLSKENAITILVVNYCCFFLLSPSKKHYLQFQVIKLINSSFVLILFCYLASFIFTAEADYRYRDFTLWERLLTQSNLFIKHFSYFLFPRPVTTGLFNDQIMIVQSTFEYAIAISIGIIIILLNCFCIYRLVKHRCYFSFCLLFFFACHLVESTVIALELYYEHRNYLPYIGLSAALAYLLIRLFKYQKNLAAIVILIVISSNLYCLYQRADLWGKPLKAAAFWAQLNPNSIRAQENAAVKFSKVYQYEQAIYYLKKAYELEKSPFILLNAINLACKGNFILNDITVSPGVFKTTSPSNRDWYVALETVTLHTTSKCLSFSLGELKTMINNMIDNPYNQSDAKQQKYLHLRALLYLKEKNVNLAINDFSSALLLIPKPDILLLHSATLATNGFCEQAINYLENNQEILFKLNEREKLIDWLYPSQNEIVEYQQRLKRNCSKEESLTNT
ncbi:tetratricopeptide repeat protein [Aliikangiella maris]|uniref:Uncharacterized protein n=2 Tax=Aliikangiella maris TaxID=3162458 RepID=A0ABV2BSU9_9GAMM